MNSMDDHAARQQALADELERLRRRDRWLEERAYVVAGWMVYFSIIALLVYALLGWLEGR